MRSTVAAGLLMAMVSGCAGNLGGTTGSSSTPGADCDEPGAAVDLGVPIIDRPAYFSSSGGVVRLTVSDLPEGVIVGAIDETAVWLGQGQGPPRADPQQPKQPVESSHRVVVGPDAPATVDLAAGRHWVVSARPGRVAVSGCGGVEISEATRAEPNPDEVFGSASEADR